jgi:hypothetical protein
MKRIIFILIVVVSLFFVYKSSAQTNYFELAKERTIKYNPKRKDYVIIIDYQKNIFSERLFVLDMNANKIILSSKVSHAWNSGLLTPILYSNNIGSNKTSRGNYITQGTKYGNFGYSMIINGLDYGVNNNAKLRTIIFHSNTKMKTFWSNGCFATSEEVNKKLIDLTKNGVLICIIN